VKFKETLCWSPREVNDN